MIPAAREVSELPGFDPTQFPPVPEAVLNGGLLIPYASPWRKAEYEIAAAVLISFGIEQGKWWPMTSEEWFAYFKRTTHHLAEPQEHRLALERLLITGEIERIACGDQIYMAPTPTLVRKGLEQSRPMIFPGSPQPATA